MMLKDKVAVIYGAGGAIGGAVSRAFASEGATVFVTGRLRPPVDAVAGDIISAGGSAEAATIDALDEQAVDSHLQYVVERAGRVDISFNAAGMPNAKIFGVPLAELDAEQFALPITTYAMSYFLTARLAARRMLPNKAGVIMTATALHSRTGLPQAGGYGPAMAAKEALTRGLAHGPDPPATTHDARGDGQRRGLRGLRQSQRDDRNHRQPDPGQSRRLAA
jgi:NAD(P)-dependent dehydrogenase (short-subunit alcohol dehydrogenase family)